MAGLKKVPYKSYRFRVIAERLILIDRRTKRIPVRSFGKLTVPFGKLRVKTASLNVALQYKRAWQR
ncbi:MAG: hypothetical protein JWQ40_3188 [Segetibacter sp.]|nr:hypothetical protein [Segetibacter sp.]